MHVRAHAELNSIYQYLRRFISVLSIFHQFLNKLFLKKLIDAFLLEIRRGFELRFSSFSIGSRMHDAFDRGYACLDIEYTIPDDTGAYSCVVQNSSGSVEAKPSQITWVWSLFRHLRVGDFKIQMVFLTCACGDSHTHGSRARGMFLIGSTTGHQTYVAPQTPKCNNARFTLVELLHKHWTTHPPSIIYFISWLQRVWLPLEMRIVPRPKGILLVCTWTQSVLGYTSD